MTTFPEQMAPFQQWFPNLKPALVCTEQAKGGRIFDRVDAAMAVAEFAGMPVMFWFNDIPIHVEPTDLKEGKRGEILDRYDAAARKQLGIDG